MIPEEPETEEEVEAQRRYEEAAEAMLQAQAEAKDLEKWKASLDKILETEEEPAGEIPNNIIESKTVEEITGVKPEEEESLKYSPEIPEKELSRSDEDLVISREVIVANDGEVQEEIWMKQTVQDIIRRWMETEIAEEKDRISEEILIKQEQLAERS
ncbi:hypothetical protein K438DRAFT_1956218 [Mycena galopus ATCC 62051]|nr:hypothetical protein K438DRAFT_1956218 [Mycena galopus ATCC 62051]